MRRIALAFVCLTAPAFAQTTIKARALVMVDTSGSMVWHFGDCDSTGGDGDSTALYCDNNIGTGFTCAMPSPSCDTLGIQRFPVANVNNPSRLYAAKAALTDAIYSASGSIDFGLERFAPGQSGDFRGVSVCNNSTYCCGPVTGSATSSRCVPKSLDDYGAVSSSGDVQCNGSIVGKCNLTWAGGCGASRGCVGAACASAGGGQVLVTPSSNSSNDVLPWLDYKENACNYGSGKPANPELRAHGGTPLAGSIRTALSDWYLPIKNGGSDPQIDCRPYVNIVMTDGVESCVSPSPMPSPNFNFIYVDPVNAVAQLTAANPNNPVKTYVIGMAFNENEKCNPNPADTVVCPKTGPTTPGDPAGAGCKTRTDGVQVCACNNDNDCGTTCEQNDALNSKVHYVCNLSTHVCEHPALTTLNAMAAAGGTGKAHFAQSQIDIEAAFAQIEADTIRIEVCNGIDDDCNGQCDEQFPDVAVVANPAPGKTCSNVHAANTCNNGALQGTHCFASGVFICDPTNNHREICNAATCATNPALCPSSENHSGNKCDGTDDDCNGVIDDCTPFVANSCCSNTCPACAIARGATGPFSIPETCDGCDEDCDGVVDNHLTDVGQACATGCGGLSGVTFCCSENNAGPFLNPTPMPSPTACTQSQNPKATNNDHLVCLGGTQPGPQQCNGCDNDCDGLIDAPTQACYDGVGGLGSNDLVAVPGVTKICHAGLQTCNANSCPQTASFGACVGEQLPKTEVCNNIDDDCDGTVDNLASPMPSPFGQPCCPTGNLADCMGALGSMCHTGVITCVAGQNKCVGAVQKGLEVCNGVDDDCNGMTDDVPGEGADCASMGAIDQGQCRTQLQCTGTFNPDGPRGLTCVQLVSPMPEICNGLDDDCDGQIDENDEVTANDPRIGVSGGAPCPALMPIDDMHPFPATGAAQPCNPGTTICKNGAPACDGFKGPEKDLCDGVPRDCTGNPNTNGDCGNDLVCVQGNCLAQCANAEFPCPGGFTCDRTQSPNVCVPDKCVAANCPAGQLCQIDSNGDAKCVDPCSTIQCTGNTVCKDGRCQANDCTTNGCPVGQRCTGTPPMCVTDPCSGVTCTGGQFCDPSTGMCVAPCTTCPDGQVCLDNKCQNDPCDGHSCPTGQVCTLMGGMPTCIQNQCLSPGCNAGTMCCKGMCISDPCEGFSGCPSGTTCGLDDACHLTCFAPPKDKIAAAGGGGLLCSASGHGDPTPVAVAAVVLLLLLMRRRLGLLMIVALLAVAMAATGCTTNPYCLNCTNNTSFDDGGTIKPDLAQPDLLPQPDLTAPPDLAPGPDLTPPCDTSKLNVDPNNCGACGVRCDSTNLHRLGICDNGTCKAGDCIPGFVANPPDNPSCNYQCTVTNGGVEICDGKDNDCNGSIDEPFTSPSPFGFANGDPLKPLYNMDTNNCGACNGACAPEAVTGGVMKCVSDAANGMIGGCFVDHCLNDSTNGTFKITNFMAGSLYPSCDKHCAFKSTTVTTGSEDCNTVSCAFPAEVCNGIDDDCNFAVDDNLTDTGVVCANTPGNECPGGLVQNCIGECKSGLTQCNGGILACVGSKGPTAEVCDGKDNDCNGLADDIFTQTYNNTAFPSPTPSPFPNYDSDKNNCGACGNVCNLANAVNGCRPGPGGVGECFVVQCNQTATQGFAFLPGQPGCVSGQENGATGCGCNYMCPVWPTHSETCNAKDDDCNGLVDDGLIVPALNCSTKGVCGTGPSPAPKCNGANGFQCDYSGITGVELDGNGNLALSESSCDNKDNNCNGVVDKDGFPTLGNNCSAGIGACRQTGTVCCGTTAGSCAMPSTGVVCSATPNLNAAADESCNGIDDNCDGQIDEAVPSPGAICFKDINGANVGSHDCKGWHDVMVAVPKAGGGNIYVYSYEASRVDAKANSPGSKEDRACSKPNVDPWFNVDLANAQAACAAVLDSKRQPLRLCTVTEWQKACEGPSPSPAPRWSEVVTPATYDAGVCNDVNASIGSPWDTGGPACYTDWGSSGQIFDLSGNVREWTSTPAVNGGVTYYHVRGGDFATAGPGTSCEFDFDLEQPGLVSSFVGFRCCADNPVCGDVTSDPNNCGTCGHVCGGGTPKCQAGACVATCTGTTDCSGACVDTSTDVNHCGSCASATSVCDNGQSCVGGTCQCAAPLSTCTINGNATCVNEQTDANHCGSCTNVCSPGQFCSAGSCVNSCGGGLTQCGTSCVNFGSDNSNCGGCGNTCGFGQTCTGGTCCNNSSICGGVCVDFQTDNNNCGACGSSGASHICSGGATCQSGICCAAGQVNCGGTCVNLSTSNGQNPAQNCGACGNTCSGTCTNGSCCPAGQHQCGSTCVSFTSDNNNCGSCFNVCSGTTPSCSNGVCCGAGQTGCGGACIDTQNDSNNCGGCGNKCPSGSVCKNGTCNCGNYMAFCNGSCIPTAVDPNNCGGCGTSVTPNNSAHICNSSQVCSNGTCTTTCGFGLTACAQAGAQGKTCRDVTDDRDFCGSCTQCTSGNGCLASACTGYTGGLLPFNPNPGGICGTNGIGPVITLSPSASPRAAASDCSGDIAATTFTFGLCACTGFSGQGASDIDAWDSRLAPYGVSPNLPNTTGTLGGSIGVNANFAIGSTTSVSGDLDAFGNLDLPSNLTLGEQLHCGGTQTGAFVSGGLAEIVNPAGSGTVGQNPNGWGSQSFPDRNMYSGTSSCSGYSILNGGTCKPIVPPGPQLPCKRCDTAQQVTISAYIANYATKNDNALIGLSSSKFASNGAGVLDLPCGYYYLSGINAGGAITITAHGNTALFIDGPIVGNNNVVSFGESPGARFDIFVKGPVDLSQTTPQAGNSAYPANQRMYVACSSNTTSGSCSATVPCCGGTCNSASTTISGSQAFPRATINVASSASFPASGTIFVTTSNGVQTVTCTGTGTGTFTGCSGGSGTAANGASVTTQFCSASTVAINAKVPASGVFIGDYYFPNGEMDVKGGAALYGALFGNQFVQSGGNVSLHYDRANAGDSNVCAPPTGNTCSSCLDCANQACVSGTCGSCTTDSQCCAPLRCVDSVGNKCTSSGCSCQFTGF